MSRHIHREPQRRRQRERRHTSAENEEAERAGSEAVFVVTYFANGTLLLAVSGSESHAEYLCCPCMGQCKQVENLFPQLVGDYRIQTLKPLQLL